MSTKVIFWNVQHGHATYIKSPNDRHIVVDLGTGSYGNGSAEFSPLQHLRSQRNVHQLDYVVITHPHKDHIDDIFNFDSLNPKTLCRPKHLTRNDVLQDIREQDKPKFEKYFEIDHRYNSEIVSYNDPSNPDNYGGLDIKKFIPRECATSNLNNQSIIVIISYANSKIVIPGDNEKCSFDELMDRPSFRNAVRDADILLAPHHGRASGYDADFVDLVNPRLTVVSDGRFVDTSATSRYSERSRGWTVHHRSGGSETRYCVTTRNDGVILAELGHQSNGKAFLSVTID